MDYEAWRFWVWVGHILVTTGLALYVWMSDRRSARKADMDRRLEEHNNRLIRVENTVEHGPKHDDLKRIHQRMDEAASAISNIAGEFRAVKGTLDLIHQYLLNNNGGKR